VTDQELDEMGPVDYIVVEWPGSEPSGAAAPLLIDLVDRGLIRVLDLAFVRKSEDGEVQQLDVDDLAAKVEGIDALVGASSGLVGDEDIAQVGAILDEGSTGALLVYENAWAAPFAHAVRKAGGQLIANGRIPVQGILAVLDAVEDAEASV
jgi:hypothetical protein